jgi:hypothetical protein
MLSKVRLDSKVRLAHLAGGTNWFRVAVVIQLVALLFAAVPLTITPAAILGGLAAVMAGLHIFAGASRLSPSTA